MEMKSGKSLKNYKTVLAKPTRPLIFATQGDTSGLTDGGAFGNRAERTKSCKYSLS
jgi:hypothetical protein